MSYVTQENIDATVRFVMRRIHAFEEGIKRRQSQTIRELAVLRHGLGNVPGSYPEAWQVAFDNCPETLLGYGEKPSSEEYAIYVILTNFAMHMQGSKTTMNNNKMPFGTAMRRLSATTASDKTNIEMPRSMSALITSDSIDEMEYYLRQSLSRLRSEHIGVDYAKLTSQVLRFQDEFRRDGVRLEWSREFSRMPMQESMQDADTSVSETGFSEAN